jgi:hypothetical protein
LSNQNTSAIYNPRTEENMIRLLCVVALAASLSGCIVAPPYGYAPAPAYGYGYGYAPAYYAAPSVDVGIGFGGYGHGWRR